MLAELRNIHSYENMSRQFLEGNKLFAHKAKKNPNRNQNPLELR